MSSIKRKIKRSRKPYLLRHLGILTISAWLFFVGVILLGMRVIQNPDQPNVLGAATTTYQYWTPQKITTVHGVSLEFDADVFSLTAIGNRASGEYTIASEDLVKERALTRIRLVPSSGTFMPSDAATRLDINFDQSVSASEDSPLGITTEIIATSSEDLGEIAVQKTTSKHRVKIGDQAFETYSIVWSGTLGSGVPLQIELNGLKSATVPELYRPILASLSVGEPQVLGRQSGFTLFQAASAQPKLDQLYITDAVSPAVVKIYHVVCGALVIDGREASRDTCDASTGSGFFVSSDGYIATNGHVVTLDAEDVLINTLLKNPAALPGFLRYIGLSDDQIAASAERPELLAAIIAKIYDAPPDAVSLKDKRSAIIVALGSRPLTLTSETDAREAINWRDSDQLKKARLIASNYSAKDLFVIASDSEAGFSSSDVALIKVNAPDTPYIELFDGQVAQNQKITIIGFPGDADNQLTDNKSLSTTVTNGSISAIRLAAGSSYRLYQSDADASRGNSGGPVINDSGEAMGLLTYRFKSEQDVDAAKSYIRDIADIRALAHKSDVALGGTGITQTEWRKGLHLFSKNQFTKAITAFKTVKQSYPAHRLVTSYERSAEDAIKSGRDVKDLPLLAIIVASFIGAAGAASAVILIARHHTAHRAYKLNSGARILRPHSHHKGPNHYASA